MQTVLGFALDGLPITGPKVTNTSILTTADLDECHGTTSAIMLDGKKVTIYHYVTTQAFLFGQLLPCDRNYAARPGASTASNLQ